MMKEKKEEQQNKFLVEYLLKFLLLYTKEFTKYLNEDKENRKEIRKTIEEKIENDIQMEQQKTHKIGLSIPISKNEKTDKLNLENNKAIFTNDNQIKKEFAENSPLESPIKSIKREESAHDFYRKIQEQKPENINNIKKFFSFIFNTVKIKSVKDQILDDKETNNQNLEEKVSTDLNNFVESEEPVFIEINNDKFQKASQKKQVFDIINKIFLSTNNKQAIDFLIKNKNNKEITNNMIQGLVNNINKELKNNNLNINQDNLSKLIEKLINIENLNLNNLQNNLQKLYENIDISEILISETEYNYIEKLSILYLSQKDLFQADNFIDTENGFIILNPKQINPILQDITKDILTYRKENTNLQIHQTQQNNSFDILTQNNLELNFDIVCDINITDTQKIQEILEENLENNPKKTIEILQKLFPNIPLHNKESTSEVIPEISGIIDNITNSSNILSKISLPFLNIPIIPHIPTKTTEKISPQTKLQTRDIQQKEEDPIQNSEEENETSNEEEQNLENEEITETTSKKEGWFSKYKKEIVFAACAGTTLGIVGWGILA